MSKRRFDDEKIQNIYDTEFAKEIAKVDANDTKKKLTKLEMFFICICLVAILLYLFKLIKVYINFI